MRTFYSMKRARWNRLTETALKQTTSERTKKGGGWGKKQRSKEEARPTRKESASGRLGTVKKTSGAFTELAVARGHRERAKSSVGGVILTHLRNRRHPRLFPPILSKWERKNKTVGNNVHPRGSMPHLRQFEQKETTDKPQIKEI